MHVLHRQRDAQHPSYLQQALSSILLLHFSSYFGFYHFLSISCSSRLGSTYYRKWQTNRNDHHRSPDIPIFSVIETLKIALWQFQPALLDIVVRGGSIPYWLTGWLGLLLNTEHNLVTAKFGKGVKTSKSPISVLSRAKPQSVDQLPE